VLQQQHELHEHHELLYLNEQPRYDDYLLIIFLGAFKNPATIPTTPRAIKMNEKVFNLLENVYISIIFKKY
jgi:hypothetical protein